MDDLIVVQARLGSSRLPGKVLEDLDGIPLLVRLLRRLAHSRCFSGVLVATTGLPEDDAVAAVALREGALVHRGDAEDVLGRFVAAAEANGVRRLARVSADSPFLDAEAVDTVARAYDAASVDIAQNHREPGWPVGTAVEVLDREVLDRLSESTDDPRDREHVTIHAYEHPDTFTTVWVPPSPACEAPELRLVVDTPEDLEHARRIQAIVGSGASLADVVAAARSVT